MTKGTGVITEKFSNCLW